MRSLSFSSLFHKRQHILSYKGGFLLILWLCSLSCTLPPEERERYLRLKEKKRAKSADEKLVEENFSKFEEVYLKVTHKTTKAWREEKKKWLDLKKKWALVVQNSVTANQRKEALVVLSNIEWILRQIYQKKSEEKRVFLGYLETRMRGFYVDRKYTYFVYGKGFHQPIGFFFEDGKTYRYKRNIDDEIEEIYLGTFQPLESLQQIYLVEGEIELKPIGNHKKGKGGI